MGNDHKGRFNDGEFVVAGTAMVFDVDKWVVETKRTRYRITDWCPIFLRHLHASNLDLGHFVR